MYLTNKLTITTLILLAAITLLITACSDENPVAPQDESDDFFDKSLEIIFQDGSIPPDEQVSVALGDESLLFWPYTGTTYDATPVDPINIVFAGEVDPLQIRAALLALDGDRTAFGFPDAPPFNSVWLDALGGDVQTTYATTGDGWVGSVVQLTLGDYGPIRFHLRLFRTGNAYGEGSWTLGGAHFELQIPGTTSHQVLSWEFAEQLVVADLMRTGLLDAEVPMVPTGPINASPSFRSIPPEIYNLLPPELIAIVGGPEPPVTEPVPLVSDGQGTILNVTGAAPVIPEVYTANIIVEFNQMVPRPFCSVGPGDYLMVTGPVDLWITTEIHDDLQFTSQAEYTGQITAQPFDLSGGDPVPVGDPFPARVSGLQHGSMSASRSRILAIDRRMTRDDGGPQILVEQLEVPHQGLKTYQSQTQCIDD